jgi:hypothetical protein
MGTPVPNVVRDLRLHVSQGILGEGMREQSPLLCILLRTNGCKGTRLAFLGILNGPVPVRLDDVGFPGSVDVLQGRCRVD